MSVHSVNPAAPGGDLHSRFQAACALSSDAPAMVLEGGTVSHADMGMQVLRCAAGLQQRGCGIGTPVAVLVPNGPDFIVAAFAVFAIGGILVPLNPKFKDDEIRHCVETSLPRVVLHPASLDDLMDRTIPGEIHRAHSVADLSSDAAFTPPSAIDLHAPALYMFSSGSTGKSKRVTRTQAHVLAEYDALAATAGLTASDRMLCTVPMYHAHGFCNAMMASMLSGGSIVLPSAEFNARHTAALLAQHHVTVYPSVPFMIKMLGDTRFAERPDLSRLRLVFTAGAPLPEAVSAKFADHFGVTVGQLYGSTESGAITLNVLHQADKPGSVGRPLQGFEVQIRGDDGDVLPPTENGEIWIRTPATTRAYDGLPDVSAEHFVGDWFFAGDTGWMDADGDIYVTGRKKLMINVAGYKVDPLEVEEVLSRHPAVAESVVMGVPHPGYGERIKAAVVLRPEGPACGEHELIEFVAGHLAEYKVPKVVEFRAEIPRSPLGKILRKYL
jgi:long-chain acyl-CoA synthetase